VICIFLVLPPTKKSLILKVLIKILSTLHLNKSRPTHVRIFTINQSVCKIVQVTSTCRNIFFFVFNPRGLITPKLGVATIPTLLRDIRSCLSTWTFECLSYISHTHTHNDKGMTFRRKITRPFSRVRLL